MEIICLLKPIFWGRSLIPNLSLDYQKNIKYNSNKQVVSSLTTLLYGQHRNSFSLDSRPNILHAPEFFAHPHRVLFCKYPVQLRQKPFSFQEKSASHFLLYISIIYLVIFCQCWSWGLFAALPGSRVSCFSSLDEFLNFF